VAAGATITLSASASDKDLYSQCLNNQWKSESVSDTPLTYTWSAVWEGSGSPAGSFPNGQTGASVSWVAPAAAGTIIITVSADDSGNKYNDAPVAVSHTIYIVQVDLSIEGVAPDKEDNPGGFVGKGQYIAINLYVAPSVDTGKIKLEATQGSDKIEVWNDAKTALIPLGQEWSPSEVPCTTMYVKGINASSSIGDVGLKLSYKIGTATFDDSVKLTVIDISKIPLGSSANLSPCVIGKIYIPSKYGGILTLIGGNVKLYYTDGSNLGYSTAFSILNGELEANLKAQGSPCTYTVPVNKHGWYYVKASSSCAILSIFREIGQAATRPWNGWYWPCEPSLINLYETSGSYTPLKDYDTVYGTSERANEQVNRPCTVSWWGHCWGWSLAAIACNQPSSTTKNQVSFNSDEMKGLYTELAEGATSGFHWRVGSPNIQGMPLTEIPAGPPTSTTGEPVDSWIDDIHIAFRAYIRTWGMAMNADLRASSVKINPSNVDDIWNHDIFKYESSMREAPGGNEKIIKMTTMITSNNDTEGLPSGSTNRTDTYIYILEYSNGDIVNDSINQNWISCTAYAPACIGTVEGPLNWQGKDCGITKTNVDNLYIP
jgi:hypothetical protein